MWCAELVQVNQTRLKITFKFQMNRLFAAWHTPPTVALFTRCVAFAGGYYD